MKTHLLLKFFILGLTIFSLGSCQKYGCTDPTADNYDPFAEVSSNCIYRGCTDPNSDNYSPAANLNDGSCIYSGCTDPAASNYNPLATRDNGTCIYGYTGQIVFWSSVHCCAIRVFVDGVDAGLIEYYYDANPGCNQPQGTLKLTLTEGVHTFTAQTVSGGSFTWNGTVTVQRNQCNTHELFL